MKKMNRNLLGLSITLTSLLGANGHAETPNCMGNSTYKGTITWVRVNPNNNGTVSELQLTTTTIVGDKTETHNYDLQTDPARSPRTDSGKIFYATLLDAWDSGTPIKVWCQQQKNNVSNITYAN